MFYVKRSRKGNLFPLRDFLHDGSSMDSSSTDDNDIKIEIVELSSMEEDQIVEVVTTPCESEFGDCSSGAKESKRAKLAPMSMEQKLEHRKKMNRISAQSARDRQKNLMLQQKQTIEALNTTIDILQKENKTLKATNEKILTESLDAAVKAEKENQDLKNLVSELEKKLAESERIRESKMSEVKGGKVCRCSSTSEPAVLEKYPLLKGPNFKQTLTFVLLVWSFPILTGTWTRQRSLRLLKNFPNKSCVRTPILLHLNRLLMAGKEKSLAKRCLDHVQELLKLNHSKAERSD